MSNMRIERGSTWHKWDFHVHSQLNKMLQNILQQQAEIGTASIYLKTEIEVIMDSLRHHILDYVAV